MPRKKQAGKTADEPKFEEALTRLEKIVHDLEEGELDLDRSLELFEEGVGLSRLCMKKLDAAQKRVEVLLKESGQDAHTEPFEEDEDE